MKAFKKQLESGSWNYHLIINDELFYSFYKSEFQTGHSIDTFRNFTDEYRQENGYVECPVQEAVKILKQAITTINKNIKL